MSTEILFKNIFGEPLTQQQQQLLGEDYNKELYENGNLKIRELFLKGNYLPHLSYYMSPSENLQVLVTAIQSQYQIGTFYFNKQVVGAHSVWDWERYEGAVRIGKGRKVFDVQNRQVAFQEVDINTQQILQTTKTHYLGDLGEFTDFEPVLDNGIFEFIYNSPFLQSREIIVHVNLSGFEFKDYTINTTDNILLDPMIAPIFDWNNQPYYHSASPFIP